jgi:pyruvate dehydrogenase E2 component (dihydrolipoamide acetyltransferase)
VSAIVIAVPDIGDFKDVPVIDVLVKPGDTVKREDTLITLESEKATMDVPSTADGTVTDVCVKIGDEVSRGIPLIVLELGSQAAAAASAPQSAAASVPAAPAPASCALATMPNAPPVLAGLPAPAQPVTGNGTSRTPGTAAPPPGRTAHASPAIRRFARELGVALSGVSGSGPNGRITREDVQHFVKRALIEGTPGTNGGTAGNLRIAPSVKIDFAEYGPIERKPLTRIQKIAGPNLHRNWVTIPHVTSHDDADITGLEAFRQEIGAERNVKLTLLAFLIKASIAALKQFPAFNSSLDGGEIVFKRYYHIGFAADTPDGLVVPVIKDADRKGILEIGAETAALAAKAREGKLGLGEMRGGTFTISSLGGIGGGHFTPIVNAPEVAILGVGRSATKPIWNGQQFEPKLMLPLSLSWDHRVVDGAAAARFLTHLAGVLGDMRRTLL